MAERVEDLNLPNAVVSRLIKDSLPDGVSVSKEARLALAKAASIFVLFLTSASNNVATKNNKKTISAQDVLLALQDTDFEGFIEPLRESLDNFKKAQKEKKDANAEKRKSKSKEEEERRSSTNAPDGDSDSASAVMISDDD
ncbi:DNA polymerase epsilon subunit 3 [Thrips palmi]|uniref:DNA polymerase epsilon subunit 3 n=1 Tax=Thrips palmi TaxID=161013 RepID=A0A6P9ACT8_THRPL|nr:DNA polymerase epsilon subunit 3 [Thrips palmi]XP_034255157.1 DNA polymerase epsilon subunit 3 [Thrips palmi]XP_034255158.1 DNA polymerase epsilon subunit 3 [Thrips palmi]XP_034255159.1 DNA polymerase epsilon subunit 3 [Thrips palmi]